MENQEDKWPKIKVQLEHGDWDDELEKCVDGKGLCKIRIDIILQRSTSGDGRGEMWYENGKINLVLLKESYSPATFDNLFSSDKYILSNPFALSDELCDALGIDRGFVIKAGAYNIDRAGEGYSTSDKHIEF